MTAAVKKIERMSHTMQQFNSLASPETRSDEVEAARRFQFAIHHVGINCGDPETGLETARVLCALFGLTPRTLPGISTFADPFIDCMHKKGRGAMGHICVTTTDVDGAMAHLASKGVEFIDETKKFDEQGHCTFVYLKGELSGFAFHLQKSR